MSRFWGLTRYIYTLAKEALEIALLRKMNNISQTDVMCEARYPISFEFIKSNIKY